MHIQFKYCCVTYAIMCTDTPIHVCMYDSDTCVCVCVCVCVCADKYHTSEQYHCIDHV